MKLATVLGSLLLCSSSVFAEPSVTEIHLGAPAPSPASVDQTKIDAVEHFLAARQSAGVDPSHASRARGLVTTKEHLDDAALFGPKGSSLAAFDFHDESIEPAGPGQFRVSVFLLFADAAGMVVESRDEDLTFSHAGHTYTCEALRVTNVIVWSQEAVLETARSIGASKELDEAQRVLRDSNAAGAGTAARTLIAYSLADVQKDPNGKVVVQCLRFKSDPGRRGFDVTTAPIVLPRSGDSIRVEPN